MKRTTGDAPLKRGRRCASNFEGNQIEKIRLRRADPSYPKGVFHERHRRSANQDIDVRLKKLKNLKELREEKLKELRETKRNENVLLA